MLAFKPNAVEADRAEGVDVVRVGDAANDERGFARFEFAADAIGAQFHEVPLVVNG